jgi:glutathione S-transferase
VMKLYFAPGACSLSPHIVMREAGAQYDLEQVNNQEKKTKSGTDYWTINARVRSRSSNSTTGSG